jgi:hypothetical protein
MAQPCLDARYTVSIQIDQERGALLRNWPIIAKVFSCNCVDKIMPQGMEERLRRSDPDWQIYKQRLHFPDNFGLHKFW